MPQNSEGTGAEGLVSDEGAPVDRLLSEPELRRRLNYSGSTLTRLRGKGLPHVGRGRRRRYDLGMVLRWLKAGRSGTDQGEAR